jgi:hypothetical protein
MREAKDLNRDLFPVDNGTYNLLQALVSKLEAIEAYTEYQTDEGGEIFEQLIGQEQAQAKELLEALRERIGAATVGISAR